MALLDIFRTIYTLLSSSIGKLLVIEGGHFPMGVTWRQWVICEKLGCERFVKDVFGRGLVMKT